MTPAPDEPEEYAVGKRAALSDSDRLRPIPRRFYVLLLGSLDERAGRERLERELGMPIARAADFDSAAAIGRSPALHAIYSTDPVFGMPLRELIAALRAEGVTVPIFRLDGDPEGGAPVR